MVVKTKRTINKQLNKYTYVSSYRNCPIKNCKKLLSNAACCCNTLASGPVCFLFLLCFAASFFIDRYYLVKDYAHEVQLSRQHVLSDLSSRGLNCIPSFANFIHIRLPAHIDSSAVIEQLLDSGYRVRSAGGTASILDGCIRITIGPRKQMTDFSSLLINLIDKQSAPID